jgi:hypothetical protein
MAMPVNFQARWISKQRGDALRRCGGLGRGLIVEGFMGNIIVEPAGKRLGDGSLLTAADADYELRSAWCMSPLSRLGTARALLGLPKEPAPESLALNI